MLQCYNRCYNQCSMLQSDLCDYSHAYIVVKEIIIVIRPNNGAYDKKLALMQYLIAAFQT